jgi:prevent-host-death family protein
MDGSVGAFEAKTHLSALLERVEKGESITITKHGRPVARLVPVEGGPDLAEHAEVIRRLKELRTGVTTGGIGWKALRDAGRKY